MVEYILQKKGSLWFLLLSFILFVIVSLRSYLVPFAHDEVATFFFYIQPGKFWPFLSHPDANGHFLTSALGWLSFKLFGSSPLALRLPSVLAFLVLCYAVFRLNGLLNRITAKVILTGAFLLSYNFISFYSLCRGYGLSMAFLLLSLVYFFHFLRVADRRHLFKFVLFSQLALSANLTLLFVVAVTTGVIIIRQLQSRDFFRPISMVYVPHFLLLGFWINFAFYLREAGALYYGGGDSYWQVTFSSLIETILFKSKAAEIACVLLFAVMVARWIFVVTRKGERQEAAYFFLWSFISLVTLIVAFYLLKMLVGINYPEDRTGLFFYLFFVLSLVFMVEQLNPKIRLLFCLVPLFFVFHFVVNLNFKTHCWRIYETIPQSFFDTLLKEQSRQNQRITVGGHRVREFIYGFQNYNSHDKLNHMTAPEALQMNCDYAVAYAQDREYYDGYYSEILSDEHWGFRLIKRKSGIKRELLFEKKGNHISSGNEYHNFFEILDTLFDSGGPLMAEIDFSCVEVPVPFNAWLVLQVDGDGSGDNIFIRTPLNLVHQDWNGQASIQGLVSGNIPLRVKRMVAYLWNIDKKKIEITINAVRLFRLHGEGVGEISKAKI
jgi:hypothetical protein